MDDTLDASDAPCLAGRYRLGSLLGTGGMSIVHDGFDERLQRPVAVKCLKPEMAERDDVRRRFETEARWAARLSHPNAVAVYDTGDDDGVPYMVMERLPGDTLAGRVATGPADAEWVRQIAIEVLGALGAAHEAGIVHRDVKPGNVLLTPTGHAKVADFGIAKSLGLDGERRDLTSTGQLIGTPSYLAPERLDGAPATAQSDLWSLGVVLYEALAGRKPFVGDDPIAVALAIKHEDPPPLSSLRADAPPDLVRAVERALERDPSRRWASAREMAASLRPSESTPTVVAAIAGPADATLVGTGTGEPVTPPAGTGVVRAGRRRRQWSSTWLLVVLGIVLAGLLAAFVASNHGGGSLGTGGASADGSANADLVRDLRTVADRVAIGDGPRGAETARRLRDIAALVAAGKSAGGPATSLLRDVVTWNTDGRQLYDTATRMTVDVLKRVPGVDAGADVAAANTPTVPPATVAPASGKGRGKHKHDD